MKRFLSVILCFIVIAGVVGVGVTFVNNNKPQETNVPERIVTLDGESATLTDKQLKSLESGADISFGSEVYRLSKVGDEKIYEHKFGYELKRFQDKKLYSQIKPKDDKYFSAVYKNMSDFASSELAIKKRTLANYIAVATYFADKEGNVKAGYEEYSFTQLVVMTQIQGFTETYKERFTPDIKVEDMKLLVKAVKKGTFDYLLSVAENVYKINEYLEAEKAGKAEEVRRNIEAVEEKYEKEDRVTIDGEILKGEQEVQINAPETDETAAKKLLKKLFREKDYKIICGGKPVSAESVIGNIIKTLYAGESV